MGEPMTQQNAVISILRTKQAARDGKTLWVMSFSTSRLQCLELWCGTGALGTVARSRAAAVMVSPPLAP